MLLLLLIVGSADIKTGSFLVYTSPRDLHPMSVIAMKICRSSSRVE
jgi:hypothetical protein